MRAYLEAVRDSGGAWDVMTIESQMRGRGLYPDGKLKYDLGELVRSGLVEEIRLPREGWHGADLRWRITPAGAEALERMAAGGPRPPSPEPEVIGDWHPIEG